MLKERKDGNFDERRKGAKEINQASSFLGSIIGLLTLPFSIWQEEKKLKGLRNDIDSEMRSLPGASVRATELMNLNEGFNGIQNKTYDNGQKEWEGNFLSGKQQGNHTGWYDNGPKEWEGNYKNGKREGIFNGWYKNGKKWWTKNYVDGLQDGISTTWDEAGNILSEVMYKKNYKVDV